MASGFGGQCSCTAEKFRYIRSNLEGQAPARPKNFGASRDAPSRFSPNEFGAQKKFVINHWLKPMA
jgi:hypothetical protein